MEPIYALQGQSPTAPSLDARDRRRGVVARIGYEPRIVGAAVATY
jgi:hypothetical protein